MEAVLLVPDLAAPVLVAPVLVCLWGSGMHAAAAPVETQVEVVELR